jgi:hypothetical protein
MPSYILEGTLLLIAKEHKGGGGGNGFPICFVVHHIIMFIVLFHMPLGQLVLKRRIGQLSKIRPIPQRLSGWFLRFITMVHSIRSDISEYQI